MDSPTAALGNRLKQARKDAGLTQREVAEELDLSRSSISQLEQGNRAVSSLELSQLARLYGRQVSDFFQEDGQDLGKIVAHFRSDPALEGDQALDKTVRESVRLCTIVAKLESEIGQGPDTDLIPYKSPPLRSKPLAIHQGRALADQERKRLDLGNQPVADLAGLLTSQGIRVAEHALPSEISGLFFEHPEAGPIIIVNQGDPAVRRRFSLAHEYCHALLDRDRGPHISRWKDDRRIEQRANAFAIQFLLPPEGIDRFLHHREEVRPEIDIFDVALLSHHFGVSYRATVYQLHNTTKFVNAQRRDHLLAGEQTARRVQKELWDGGIADAEPRRPLSEWLLDIALSAYEQSIISRGKLNELAGEAGLSPDLIGELVSPDEDAVAPSEAAPVG